MNRRVTIKLWTDVTDGAFGLSQTFDAGVTRWARIEPLRGLHNLSGEQIDEAATHLIWVRYGTGSKDTDITQNHVIEHKSRRYRVLMAENVEDRQVMTKITVKDLGAI